MSQGPRSVHPSIHEPSEVTLLSVPKQGKVQVIFLSDPRGLHTHYISGRPVHCPGKGICPASNHRYPLVWKGYASVEALISKNIACWLPAVLEVTDRLSIHLGEEPLRGTVWNLERRPYRGELSEVFGEKVRDIDPRGLRTDVFVEPVVQRILRCTELVWDREKIYTAPQLLSARPAVISKEPIDSAASAPPSKAAYNPCLPPKMRERMIAEGIMEPASDPKGEGL